MDKIRKKEVVEKGPAYTSMHVYFSSSLYIQPCKKGEGEGRTWSSSFSWSQVALTLSSGVCVCM